MSGLGRKKNEHFKIFQMYGKCISNQIWPCRNTDQGQPRFIICANLR